MFSKLYVVLIYFVLKENPLFVMLMVLVLLKIVRNIMMIVLPFSGKFLLISVRRKVLLVFKTYDYAWTRTHIIYSIPIGLSTRRSTFCTDCIRNKNGTSMCHCSYSTWWSNTETKNENGCSTSIVNKSNIGLVEIKLFFFRCRFFQLFEKYNGPKKGHLKLKHPGQLQVCWFSVQIFIWISFQEVLDIARTLLKELDDNRIAVK